MDQSRRHYSSGRETLPYSVTQRNSNERMDALKDISNLSKRFESSFCVSKKPDSKPLDVPTTEQFKHQSSGLKESGQEISSGQSKLKERQKNFHEASSRGLQTPESTKRVNNESSSATNKSLNQKRDVKMHNLPRYSRTRPRRYGKSYPTPPRFFNRDAKSYPSGCHSNANDSFLPQSTNPVPNQTCPESYTERNQLNGNIGNRPDTGQLQTSHSPLDQNNLCQNAKPESTIPVPNQACPVSYTERSQLNRNIGNRPDTAQLQTAHSPLDQNNLWQNTKPDLPNMKSQQWQIPPPSLRRDDMSQRSGTTYHNPPYPSGCHSDVNDSFLPQSTNPVPNQACPGRYTERSHLNRNISNRPDTGQLQTAHSPLDQNNLWQNTKPDLPNMKSQQWQIPPPSFRRDDISQRSGTTYYNPPMPPIAPVQYKQGSSYCNLMSPVTTTATPVQYTQGSSYCDTLPSIAKKATPVQYKQGSSYCNSMPPNPTPVQYKQRSSYCNSMLPIKTNATPVQYKQGSSYCKTKPYFGKHTTPVKYKQDSSYFNPMPPIITNATPVHYKQGSSYCNPLPYFGKNATPMRFNQGSVDYKNATLIRPAQLSTCYENPLFSEKIHPLLSTASNESGGTNQFPGVAQGRQDLKTHQDLTPPQKDSVPGIQHLETDKDLKLPVLQPPKDAVPGMQNLETDQDLKSTVLQPENDTVPGRQDLKTDGDLTPPQKNTVPCMQDLETDQDLKPPPLQAQKDMEPWRQTLKTDKKEPNALQPEKDMVPGKQDLKVDQYLKANQDLKPTALEHQKDIVPGRQNLETDQDLKPFFLQPPEDIARDWHDLETGENLKVLTQQPKKDLVLGLKTNQDSKPFVQQPQKDIVQDRLGLEIGQELKPLAQQPQEDLIADKPDLKIDQDLKPHVQQPQEDIVSGRQDLKTDQDLKPPAPQHQKSKTKGADNCNTLSPKKGIYVKNSLQTFAELAHYSKKNVLKVNIPKTPPLTSYFPIHAISQKGLFIGQVQANLIQFPPPLGIRHFRSSLAVGRRIIPQLPYQTVGFCTQTQVCSNFHPAHQSQATSRTAMQDNMLIPSVANAVNPMHPVTQTETIPPQMIQYQAATQNLSPALPYQDQNNPIYPYGTQYPAIQNIAAESQYQDPNHTIYQYGTEHQPTLMQSTDSQYQNLNPIYQYGTQYPPNIAENFQYQDPNHHMYQYGGQYQPMDRQSADSQYQDPNYPMHQYGMEYQPMHMQSADSQYQDPNYPMHQFGMEYQPMHMQFADSQYQDPNLMYQSGTQYGQPYQDVNAEFQYQDPNLAMCQGYGVNSSSETFRPPQTPWSCPTYDANIPSQEQNLNMLPMQTYATNPDSESTIQYPTWPGKSADQSYHLTDYLNLLPNFSGDQTAVENPPSISVSEYPSGFQTGNELTSQCTNHYQGNMSIENPEVMYTNTYIRWSDATSDSHVKKLDDTSNNQ